MSPSMVRYRPRPWGYTMLIVCLWIARTPALAPSWKAHLSLADLPSVVDIYWSKNRDQLRDRLAEVNDFMPSFGRSNAKTQIAQEVAFLNQAFQSMSEGHELSTQQDYFKLDLMRIWMGQQPVLYRAENCSFLRVGADGRLQDTVGPHAGAWSGVWIPFRKFDRSTFAQCVSAVKRGEFVVSARQESGGSYRGP